MTKPLCLAVCIFTTIALGTSAAGEMLPAWKIDGRNNSVYLVGSIHLLREEDYPLPVGIEDVYEDAETLVMELDMDDLDVARLQALVRELGLAGDDSSLADLLGAETYAQAEVNAARLNVPLAMLAGMEPWLAAITVEQLMLQRLGFNPEFGIESHFARKAGNDSKEILGLEDIAEQLGFLDSLSLEAQRLLFLQTLEEAGELELLMDRIIGAWRTGDMAFLEAHTLTDLEAYPEIYNAIVANRNRNWSERIVGMLDDEDDYLVIVGTLHLVGADSVPSILDAMGHRVQQLGQPD